MPSYFGVQPPSFSELYNLGLALHKGYKDLPYGSSIELTLRWIDELNEAHGWGLDIEWKRYNPNAEVFNPKNLEEATDDNGELSFRLDNYSINRKDFWIYLRGIITSIGDLLIHDLNPHATLGGNNRYYKGIYKDTDWNKYYWPTNDHEDSQIWTPEDTDDIGKYGKIKKELYQRIIAPQSDDTIENVPSGVATAQLYKENEPYTFDGGFCIKKYGIASFYKIMSSVAEELIDTDTMVRKAEQAYSNLYSDIEIIDLDITLKGATYATGLREYPYHTLFQYPSLEGRFYLQDVGPFKAGDCVHEFIYDALSLSTFFWSRIDSKKLQYRLGLPVDDFIATIKGSASSIEGDGAIQLVYGTVSAGEIFDNESTLSELNEAIAEKVHAKWLDEDYSVLATITSDFEEDVDFTEILNSEDNEGDILFVGVLAPLDSQEDFSPTIEIPYPNYTEEYITSPGSSWPSESPYYQVFFRIYDYGYKNQGLIYNPLLEDDYFSFVQNVRAKIGFVDRVMGTIPMNSAVYKMEAVL